MNCFSFYIRVVALKYMIGQIVPRFYDSHKERILMTLILAALVCIFLYLAFEFHIIFEETIVLLSPQVYPIVSNK